ncbi:DUF3577 domain-containing protein [Pseudomonas chengduensis]|uniref:DUF3577 domain-containing protein n=1 Tax=Pseudomonas sediminis TaxID=1691904 RepID=UPI00244AF5EB|nr:MULTISPECIES: DUF3577 domain-containing protein [Pseudomonas]MDG9757864.1 DUF3577 domain-containing protein [Pseudomonas sediminis]MDH0622930.1 DUF3577 domain-containing protein [Pseudomonas chengduensis]MDH1664575.1 DUF3577 domain-containing protein [Pseudomonas chengduensis]
MTCTTPNQKSYFDIHTSGIGYIQRVREVQGKAGRKGPPSLWCTVAALVGPATNPIKRYFDVRVSGAEAKKLVQPYVGIDDHQQRPLVRFRLGDLWVDPFIRPSGEHKGKAAASLKARLLTAELIDRTELVQVEQHELITCGIGYLRDPKDVPRTAGGSLLSCCIAALTGPIDVPVGEREYRYINTTVTSAAAQELVRLCVLPVEAKQKVLIAFRLNDMQASPYIRTKGERAGQAAASLESKLIHIGLIKIDGEQVHPQESEAPVTEGAPAPEETVTAEDDNGGPQTTVQVPVEEPARVASF